MIGRADIEGSKSDVAMNAWPPQASYPCGNNSETPLSSTSEITRMRLVRSLREKCPPTEPVLA